MSGPERILVVDDEASIRITTVLNLTREGYSTDAAPDGREAMEKISEFNPHLVLLDINLPGQNGVEICRKISSLGPGRPAVVMMTAVADKRTVTAAARAGAAGYIVKPFHTELLINKIREVLGGPKGADRPRRRRRGSGLASGRYPGRRRDPLGDGGDHA